MPNMEDDEKTWPPAPDAALPPGAASQQHRATRTPHLTVILVMWAVTACQVILQFTGLGAVGKLCGFVGFVLAVYLVSRPDRVARINGGWRFAVALLGLFVHLLDSR